MFLVFIGHANVVQLLLNNSADIHIKNNAGKEPQCLAVQLGK